MPLYQYNSVIQSEQLTTSYQFTNRYNPLSEVSDHRERALFVWGAGNRTQTHAVMSKTPTYTAILAGAVINIESSSTQTASCTANMACGGFNIACYTSNIECYTSNIACYTTNIACYMSNIACYITNSDYYIRSDAGGNTCKATQLCKTSTYACKAIINTEKSERTI